MNSIEVALKEAGYSLAFIEQDKEGVHLIRRYRIAPLETIEQRYATRHRIVETATHIIHAAVNSRSGDFDMARIVEGFCEQILEMTNSYEGHQIAEHGRGLHGVEVAEIPDTSDIDGLKPGIWVEHPKFGIGEIAHRKGDDVTVKFQKHGGRLLSVIIARLKIVDAPEREVSP